MPVTKSAIKKARQDVKARKHNRGIRDEYKKASKKVRLLAAEGNAKGAKEALKNAYSKLDIAAKKNILHKNNASRRKARLSAVVSSLSKKKAPEKTVKKEAK